jgi:hypothetical protein
MIRSRKYLNAARGQECQVRIPKLCNRDPNTVIAAHSNKGRHGKGTSLKAHDIFVTWCCSSCHDALDGRVQTDLTPAEIQDFWQWGFERTLVEAITQGIIKI